MSDPDPAFLETMNPSPPLEETMPSPIRQVMSQWLDRVAHIRQSDMHWCNTEDAPIWRSIHEYRIKEIDRCILELAAVLDALPQPEQACEPQMTTVPITDDNSAHITFSAAPVVPPDERREPPINVQFHRQTDTIAIAAGVDCETVIRMSAAKAIRVANDIFELTQCESRSPDGDGQGEPHVYRLMVVEHLGAPHIRGAVGDSSDWRSVPLRGWVRLEDVKPVPPPALPPVQARPRRFRGIDGKMVTELPYGQLCAVCGHYWSEHNAIDGGGECYNAKPEGGICGCSGFTFQKSAPASSFIPPEKEKIEHCTVKDLDSGFARCPECGNLAMNPLPSCTTCGNG